jgi:protein subunit release factor B
MPGLGAGVDKEKALSEKLLRMGVREKDIIENFVRSSGPGGQNVNKTSTCVYLKHVPTGIEVKCQRERSQALNRYTARLLLAEKIQEFIQGKLLAVRQRAEKIKRQKRGRSRKAKLKILENKRKHSQKKSLRAGIRKIDYE